MTDERIFQSALESIIEGNPEIAIEVAKKALEAGIEPNEMIDKGFVPGIMEVGERFEEGILFLPELMKAADTMKEAIAILNEALATAGGKKRSAGKFLIATVESDIHDIGKGIVASLLVANGFEVIDLGRDVSNTVILEKAVEYEVDIIGTSSLLTTTMVQQQYLENMLKEKELKGKFKTIVGGAPVTVRWANRIGADAFAENAADGVTKALELLGK